MVSHQGLGSSIGDSEAGIVREDDLRPALGLPGTTLLWPIITDDDR
jgi:hypothetical protein